MTQDRLATSLHGLIEASVRTRGPRLAVVEGNGSGRMDYTALGRLSDRLRDRLASLGVGRGDRVGLYLRKSAEGIASIVGILKAGAAYVPVDPTAPPSRNAYIHGDCGARVVIVERRFESAYREEIARLGYTAPPMIVLEAVGGGAHLGKALDDLDRESGSPAPATVESNADDLAYILYTSGSTGKPKGVMLSHRNAVSFVDWCSGVFRPRPEDVFSSHAPFHFDLSILDIYVALKHGASLVLIPEGMGKDPLALSRAIGTYKITVWYSVPSVLRLLDQFGKIADHDYSSLRLVLFAGEVFPIAHLRSIRQQVPGPTYFNLYGPTETNVCTYFEIPPLVADDRADPYPIGRTCENLSSRVVDSDGRDVAPGAEGELCIAGDNVMQGYWNLPELTENSFLPGSPAHRRWYRTGDIVVEEGDGIHRYVGRRDRMVKKRGHRVELGEIETCLYRHTSIREAAVVALNDPDAGLKIKAHLSVREGDRLSLILLKTFCSQYLPLYMVPDEFAFHSDIPKTSTGKIDFQRLNEIR
jgi:amino acid adenylation domain-containing protein